MDKNNRNYLKKYFVIYLDPPWGEIYQRIKSSNRPLVTKHSYDELYQIYEERKELYTEVANISIDDIEEEVIISKIIKIINR